MIWNRRATLVGLVGVTVLVGASCSGGGGTGASAPVPGTETPPASAASSSPSGPATAPFDPTHVRVRLRLVTAGLDLPLFVTGAGDGSGRLFVAEQGGQIRIVDDGRVLPTPFLDITSKVVSGGEQGLLGLAFDPDYRDNGRFYVDYTDRQGNTVVAEYRRSAADPNRADPSSARTILGQEQPFSNHNGGDITFGPDGDLYVALGDGGSGGDPEGNGQSLHTLLAKLLRIDVHHPSGDRNYAIPTDNPFVGRSDARPEIWAYGLRNPWRFSFDRSTHDMWIGDVGQSAFEEIDHGPAARGGQNYGWNVMEGPSCYDSDTCDQAGLTLPVASYTHDDGSCTVIGGYVYRGRAFPVLDGGYLYADYCSGKVWLLDASRPSSARPRQVLDTNLLISSFGEDDRGELYLTALASGQLFRVTSSAR